MGLCFVALSVLHQNSSAAPKHVPSSADAAPFLKRGQRANKCKGLQHILRGEGGDGGVGGGWSETIHPCWVGKVGVH